MMGFNGCIKLRKNQGIKRAKVAVGQYFKQTYVGDGIMYKRKIVSK